MALITLTSDLGLQDFLAGSVKGQLLKINPTFQLVDITHAIRDFNLSRAAYICRNALNNFPENTYHIWLINLFDKKTDHVLFAKYKQQFICCADNGLLPVTLLEKPELLVRIPLESGLPHHILEFTRIFGEVIQKHESGILPETLGTVETMAEYVEPLPVRVIDNAIEVKVLLIDSYENVILNINRPTFEKYRRGRDFKIILRTDEEIDVISESYADVPEGRILALFNASDYLEIAINKGNAAGLLGLEHFAEKSHNMSRVFSSNKLNYQIVVIQFL